jgi:hypothetical protein
MATKFRRGQIVRQIMPAPLEGVVSGFEFDTVDGHIHVLFGVKAEDGSIHTQSMREDLLEVIGDQGEGSPAQPGASTAEPLA